MIVRVAVHEDHKDDFKWSRQQYNQFVFLKTKYRWTLYFQPLDLFT